MTTWRCRDEDCQHEWEDEEEVYFCPRCGSTSIAVIQKVA